MAMTPAEWKKLTEREKFAYRCRIYCVHAYQDHRLIWRCGRTKTHPVMDIYEPPCRHYEERPQLGTQIKHACVAQCVATLESSIDAMVEHAKKHANGGTHDKT